MPLVKFAVIPSARKFLNITVAAMVWSVCTVTNVSTGSSLMERAFKSFTMLGFVIMRFPVRISCCNGYMSERHITAIRI